MTDKQSMTERNAAICKRYEAGDKVSKIVKDFKLGRQRVYQVVKDAKVRRPTVQGSRTKHLGVTVKDATKIGLQRVADGKGVSVSQLTSDVLDKVVEEAGK